MDGKTDLMNNMIYLIVLLIYEFRKWFKQHFSYFVLLNLWLNMICELTKGTWEDKNRLSLRNDKTWHYKYIEKLTCFASHISCVFLSLRECTLDRLKCFHGNKVDDLVAILWVSLEFDANHLSLKFIFA